MAEKSRQELESDFDSLLKDVDQKTATARAIIKLGKERGKEVDREEALLNTLLAEKKSLLARMRAAKGREGVN
jgi:hypothetical protein